ncbi:CRISPR-associated protein Cmr2 [Candidatus Methanomarinus sp.]|nr:CRISPR-associated protein Cmr2 [ANME-2 cluster archaeon]
MFNQNTLDFLLKIDTDFREYLKHEIKKFNGPPATRSDWMEKNLSKSLKSYLNEENYHIAIQRAVIFSKVEDEKYKNDARDGYRGLIERGYYKQYIGYYKEFLDKLNLYRPDIKITTLPKHSFFIQFKFTFKKPFYSHDDDDFYIIDNPVMKDHIFNIPMMRPSSWKGNLRSTMIKVNNITTENCDNPLIKRLFGCLDEKGKIQKKGRLIFYPTYFDNIGLEVINPHDRKTKVGTKPILYEVIPEGSSGVFSLLYIPFDLIGDADANNRGDSIVCYQKVSEAITEMMTTYGFGAKTSSGYGVVETKIENGTVEINGIDVPKSEFYTFDELKRIIGGLR